MKRRKNWWSRSYYDGCILPCFKTNSLLTFSSESWDDFDHMTTHLFANAVLFFLYWRTREWSVVVLTTWCQTSLSGYLLPSSKPCGPRKVIVDCPQPGSSRATYRLPPISRWSKCGGNDTVMVLLGIGTSKVSKETQPEWLDPTRHWWQAVMLRTLSLVV